MFNLKIKLNNKKDLTGLRCETPTSPSLSGSSVRANDPCASNPCGTTSTCIPNTLATYASSSTYICVCSPNYTGTQCNLRFSLISSVCTPSTCLNGATCISLTLATNSNPQYACVCPINYTGTRCEQLLQKSYVVAAITTCSPSPCLNGGTCYTGSQVYCVCLPNFTGFTCEISLNGIGSTTPSTSTCPANLCSNGGTCIINSQTGNSYFCLCGLNYTGTKCEILLNGIGSTTASPSASNCGTASPCLNGGTCYSSPLTNPTIYCVCNPIYTGLYCQISLNGIVTQVIRFSNAN